jgi:hypothetical protein
MRIVKEAKERRKDILDAADEFFFQKGFDGTSTNDIIKKVGIARGTLALNISGGNGKEIMEHIHQPQNALMHQKIQKVIISGVTPILTGIIREGIEQGLFSTPFPYGCMEMVVAYTNAVFDDDMVKMTSEERGSRIQAFVFNTERLLGAQSGSLMDVTQIFGSGNGGSNQ